MRRILQGGHVPKTRDRRVPFADLCSNRLLSYRDFHLVGEHPVFLSTAYNPLWEQTDPYQRGFFLTPYPAIGRVC